ncbi:MAG: CotH kinase family protein [Ruminiclostridium sp.]|nr:CotH kinase family protein [Ruminiclostridium sp.]
MKKTLLRRVVLTTAALALSLGMTITGASAAGNGLEDLTWQASPDHETAVSIQQKNGNHYLFLPSSADLTALSLTFSGDPLVVSGSASSIQVSSGQPFDLTALFAKPPADGRWSATLSQGRNRLSVTVMVSANIGSVYLTSADPVKDREWVEQNKDKNKAKGEILYLRADGSTVYAGDLKQIKGRGNSTWSYPKKPYQIKLDEKFDLLEAGESPESTWILLANYCDPTLLHNTITFDLAQAMDMTYTHNSKPVDLYYDGEYRGSYLLCEKTEVGEGRVAVEDLEGNIEDVNPQVEDMDDLSVAYGTNASGNRYQYVTGLASPEDLSGGYLLELDHADRAKAEKSWFTTDTGCYVVVKSPEYAPKETIEYISEFYQAFETAVVNGGTHPVTGKDYTEYVDLDSLAQCYLMFELTQNIDAFKTSTYFYKPAGEDKLYAGPLWDFDLAYGSYLYDYKLDTTETTARQTKMSWYLWTIPSFRDAVKEQYQEMATLIEETLLSQAPDAQTGELKSLAGYQQELSASQAMNHVLWPTTTPTGYATALADLESFLVRRHDWLYSEAMNWITQEEYVQPYRDVTRYDWYGDAVEYVTLQGLMNGVSETCFDPQNTLTRAMAVTVLYRIVGEPAPSAPAGFTDVPADQWYSNAVAWAAEQGISQGFEGLFRPNDKVTREELVTLLYRFEHMEEPQPRTVVNNEMNIIPVPEPEVPTPSLPEIPELPADPITPSFPDWIQGTGSFTDLGLISDWAVAPFIWAIETGIITGNSDGTLNPQGNALRCQFAAMIQRYHQTIV